MHCYLPSCCLFPLSFLIIGSGLLYAIIFGRMTGFYSIAVGMLFVISGFFGVFSSCWRTYISSFLFSITVTLASIVALVVNVAGFLFPQYVFLLNETEDTLNLLGINLSPNTYWFGIALVYLTIIHIPLLSFSICNVCTIRGVIKRDKKRKQKILEKQRRKEGFFMYRGNNLKNRIRPEEFTRIREELNRAVRSSYTPTSDQNTSDFHEVGIDMYTHID